MTEAGKEVEIFVNIVGVIVRYGEAVDRLGLPDLGWNVDEVGGVVPRGGDSGHHGAWQKSWLAAE